MENKYLIDSNILIYYLNGTFQSDNKVIDDIIQASFNISIITRIELFGWAGYHTQEKEYKRAVDFLDNAMVYPLDDDIAEATIQLRQKGAIKMPDAIIAGTALVHDLELVTNNVKDFKNLGIPLFNLPE